MTPVKQTRGMTLIEMVVAMALGVPVLLMLTSTFASGSKTVSRVTEELYFYTEFHELSQLITRDVRRAGYSLSGAHAGTVKWPNHAELLYVNPAQDCIAYAYEFNDGSGLKTRYTSIYRDSVQRDVVKLHTKQIPDGSVLPRSEIPCDDGESITDSHTTTVTELQFDVSGSAVEVTLGMKSRDGVYQNSATFNVTVVN